MKRALIIALAVILAISFTTACKRKPAPKLTAPQVKEQPKVEEVNPTPPVRRPDPSEEELFMSKSLEQINKDKPLGMIHFDYDKFAVREDAKPVLQANAAWLLKWPSAKILIEGHCDDRGTEDYNLALGEKRAKSAYEYLIALGVSADRMRIISYGKSQPLDMGDNESAWARNRRDQFLVIEK
jgi:peptidoglycan-associated lipoprotein